MKIVHNGLFLTRPNTGMGQYSVNLLQALPKAMPKDEHIILVPEPVDIDIPGATVKVVRPSWNDLVKRGVALDRWESRDLPKAAAGYGADVYHAPYPTPPAQGPFATLMAVHDMIPWQFPQYRKGLRTKYKLARLLAGTRSADVITTVSKSAAADIVEIAGVPKKRIQVTYDGVGPEYRKRPSMAVINKVKKKYKLTRPYILYIGGFDYRKNVRGLIEGFAASGLTDSHELVIAGSVAPPTSSLHDDFNHLEKLLKRADVHQRTKRPGFVDEADKPALIAGADAFVYPSLAEGFGIPVLEALGVGTPVAASDIPPIKEVFGGAVTLFDPEDTTQIVSAIRETVERPSATQRKRGSALAKRYTWDAVAKRTAVVFRSAKRK